MNRRPSANPFARFSGSDPPISEELLTQAMRSLCAEIARFVCLRWSGVNAGWEGRSRLPCNPRNSIAANPFAAAKSRILAKSQAGQPRVEKAIGSCCAGGSHANAEQTAPAVSAPRKLRRVVFMRSNLLQANIDSMTGELQTANGGKRHQ